MTRNYQRNGNNVVYNICSARSGLYYVYITKPHFECNAYRSNDHTAAQTINMTAKCRISQIIAWFCFHLCMLDSKTYLQQQRLAIQAFAAFCTTYFCYYDCTMLGLR